MNLAANTAVQQLAASQQKAGTIAFCLFARESVGEPHPDVKD